VLDKSGGVRHTIATFNMYVGLPHNFKGTHMSRFVEILNSHERGDLGRELRDHAAGNGRAPGGGHRPPRNELPLFHQQGRARYPGVKSLMDYEVTFIGEIIEGGRIYRSRPSRSWSRSPASAPARRRSPIRGAHNQRSHVTITATTNQLVWIEDIVRMAETQASCELYGLLKRPDEKYVTERAYDNPKFVEDLVRDVAGALNADPRIDAYVVESENFESIHNHSAYALIECNKKRY
jgi:GTP cyclohydrolase I